MKILGISALYHDSAAALLIDGNLAAAAQEERFTRVKNDANFPVNSIEYCLSSQGLRISDIDYVSFYEKPFLKFERLIETYLALAPRGFQSFRRAIPIWVKEKLFQKKLLLDELKRLEPGVDWSSKLLFAEHHQSHAASAYFPSPFEEAVVLTMDGVGEWATTSLSVGRGAELKIMREIHFPHSIGLLYSAFTFYAGFRVNSDEYKLMGLAPYGNPKFSDLIYKNIIYLKADGSFKINQEYFDYCSGIHMINKKFEKLFGAPARAPDGAITQHHMDIAASIQAVTEEVVIRLARSARADTGIPNLCLAGGVALNCVANGKLMRAGIFDRIWIQPAAGDAGGAVGAAYSVYHGHCRQHRDCSRLPDGMAGAYLGPSYTQDDIERRLTQLSATFETLSYDAMIEATSEALASGKAVGWFQGRMEFGPRALGNRSILGDARSPTMQKTLNLRVKHRESFRPFGPSVLREELSDWFEINEDSPYMLMVAPVLAARRIALDPADEALFGVDRLNVTRSIIPAVTHVDYSSRIQTVRRETNPVYYDLICAFKNLTGCPVIINTSFNVRDEPIVCTPEDAFRCFMDCDIEILVIGNCFLQKENQDKIKISKLS